ADLPFLELPPIKDWFRGGAAGNRNIRGTFSLHDSQHKVSSFSANLFGTYEKTARSAGPKISVGVNDDRPVRGLGNDWQNVSCDIGPPGIGIDPGVKNCGVFRKIGDLFSDRRNGQSGQINEFKFLRSKWNLLAERKVIRMGMHGVADKRKAFEIG